MIQIELQDCATTMIMRIQGSFAGKHAENARGIIAHRKRLPKLIVDLSEVSMIDSTGEEVLSWLGGLGGEFIVKSPHSQNVCERLHLREAVSPSRSPVLLRAGARSPVHRHT